MDRISEILATYNCVNLEDRIQYDLDSVVEKEMKQAYHVNNLKCCISCMDYTTLKLSDTEIIDADGDYIIGVVQYNKEKGFRFNKDKEYCE